MKANEHKLLLLFAVPNAIGLMGFPATRPIVPALVWYCSSWRSTERRA